MRFGYFARPGVTYQGMLELALDAEELGIDGVYLNDHVMGLFGEETMPFLEAMTTLAAIGVQTSRVRLGHITIMNSLRNPALLAKTISTLDNLFDGRYDVILGAGWMRGEYEGYDLTGDGSGVPPGWVRADQMVETIKILKGMLANEEWSYESKYWKLKNAYNYPLPIQQPMPIIVGGSKKRLVRIAAKYADGLNVLAVGGGLGSIRAVLELLQPALEKYDRGLGGFDFSAFDHTVQLFDNMQDYKKAAKQVAEQRRRPLSVVESDMFMGTSEVLVQKLRMASDMGLNHFIFYVRPKGDVRLAKENLEKFRDTVIKAL